MIDVITGITTAINITKKLKEVNDKTKNAEISNLIADLMIELANVKALSADLRIENADLKEKIRSMENVAAEKMILKDNAYYTEDEDGPFCTRCYDENRKKIRLKLNPMPMRRGTLHCPLCLTEHLKKGQ